MRVNPKPWTASRRGLGVIIVLIVAVAIVLIVVLARGLYDDPPAQRAGTTDKASAGYSHTAESPAATSSPDSEPSSGPTEVPEPGSLETVEVEEVTVAPPVGLDETGDFGTGLTLRVDKISAVDGVARGPGQVSGPALRLVMEATNASASPVSLEGMVVDLTYGTGHTPAMPLSEPDARPFEAELAARAEALAVYVFAVPEKARGRITVSASYTGSAPTVVFAGAA